MGLYTKKVKEDTPVKEVKKRGRPKKSEPLEEKEIEVEQPKEEEPVPVEQEPPKEPEVQAPPTPVEKITPPQEPEKEDIKESEPSKKDTVKKKVVKKVEKKVAPKEEEPPAWFKKFIAEVGHEPKASKKENKDMVKEVASHMWNKGVKPRGSGQTESDTSNRYEKLYNQIFGR